MLRSGQIMMLVAIALLTFGVVMVNSAGLTVDGEEGITLNRVLFSRATVYAAFAVGMMLLGSHVPVHWLYSARGWKSPVPILVVGMILLLLAAHVPGLSRSVNGSSRWIEVGGLSFQPSEFAKWGILIALAWYGARRAGAMHRLTVGFLPPMLLVGVVCLLIAIEDLGTAVLIGLVSVLVLIAAGVRLWQAAMVIPVGALGFVAMVLHNPYRINRLLAYLDPYQDPQGIGYHIIQSMMAVSSGGLAGRGLGNGVRKFGYLPEDTTDFIFAIICEELGIFGAALVIFLYIALILCGLSILRRIGDNDSDVSTSRKGAIGNGQWAMGDRQWAMGNRQWAVPEVGEASPADGSSSAIAHCPFPIAPLRTFSPARSPLHLQTPTPLHPHTAFPRLLALGVILTIGLQAAINIAVVTGVAPTKGIALPLLSHGGTGWALTAFSLGLLVSMERSASSRACPEGLKHGGPRRAAEGMKIESASM